MTTIAPPAFPDADGLRLRLHPCLACGLCQAILVRGSTTCGELRTLLADHIEAAHRSGLLTQGPIQLRGERTHRIVHRSGDFGQPSLLDIDVLATGGPANCALCGYSLLGRRITFGQLLERVAVHLVERHSGRRRSPRELRAARGLDTSLPEIRRPSWTPGRTCGPPS